MATTTTNLGLTKPGTTDKIRIAQINGNMDILDEKIGAVGNTSLQSQLTTQSAAIAKVDSNSNQTNDVLADAVSATTTTFFKGSGSSYTGTQPTGSSVSYASFIVNVRGSNRYVIAINPGNRVFVNAYDNAAWSGWQEIVKGYAARGTYTPTITSASTGFATANKSFYYTRSGDILVINGRFEITDVGSDPTNSTFYISLPTGMTCHDCVGSCGTITLNKTGVDLSNLCLRQTSSSTFFLQSGAGGAKTLGVIGTGYICVQATIILG